jgi:hypothetical protein
MVSYLFRFFLTFNLRALLGVLVLMGSLVGCNPKVDSTNDIRISSLSVSSGTINGGSIITITGSGFTFIEGVTFDQSQCTDMTLVSSTSITCTVPAHAAGTVTVRVYGLANRSATTSYSYMYVAPTITTFSPSAGKLAGGTTLLITGTGFFAGATAAVGGVTCSNVVVSSTTLASCTLPAQAAGAYTVELTNIDALSGTSATSYTYQPAPTVTSVSPTSGFLAGGATMTVTGTGFLTGATVKIGPFVCTSPTVSLTLTSITCGIPALIATVYSVTVTNSDSQPGSLASAYTARAAPTVTSASPSVGPVAGGTAITITGTGFYTGASVTINALTCTGPTVVSSTSITCTTPANAAGAYTIAVTNADTQTGSKASGYTYQPAPTVTSVSPTSGALAGGGTLTLTGIGFLSGASVTIGANTCTSPVVVSSTSMTCVLPAKAAGAYTATVTNADTQPGSLGSAYTYQVAPTVSSVAPLTGPLAGGTTITITGADFISGATVTVDGSTCASPNVVNSTTLTCVTAAHAAGAVSVVVTNPDFQVGPLASAFTYQAAPTVTSVSPAGGNAAGGTTITITGTGFLTGAIVDLDSIPCTSPTFVNSTTLTCVTAAHASGLVQVDVTNTDSQVGSLASAYTYLDAPTVTSVAPNAGALAGGSAVTITGTGFFAGATVDFDGISCTGVTVVSDTSITCTTGGHAAGAVNVTVTNIDTQNGIGTSVYSYQVAPTVSSVSPSYGPIGGGTNITITGSDFLALATVNVGANPCTTVVVVNSTSITCDTPFSITSGTASVSVTNSDGQSHSLTSGFLYILPPTISGVSPNAGALAGGTTLTISGSSFFTGATVTVGATACTSPTVVGPTSITCILPAMAAGAYDVVVTNPDTQFVTASSAYTYQVPPTISSVSPASGALAGGTSITLTGTDFVTGASVTVGGLTCSSVVVVNSTSITCVTPANSVGTYAITVTNSDGQNDSVGGLYTYQAAPSVASVTPASGALAGGTLITITGANFIAGAAVNVGASACTGVSVVSSTSITCNTPANAAGVYSITVTNVDAQSGALASAFTYQAAPTVTGLSPNVGALAGGTAVVITGTGFLSGATATIGGSACMTPTVASSTSVSCILPAQGAGAYTATVTNTDTQSGSLVSAYTYQAAPTLTSVSPNVGPLAGGTVITLTGTGFLTGATANINGTSCTGLTVVNSTSITCTTQAKAAGVYSLTVTNSDSQSVTLANAFTYQAAPTVTSVSSNGGALAGGNLVTVSGSAFLAGITVDFGGSLCGGVTVLSSSSLTCTTSAHAAGAVTVTVTNTDSQNGNVASGYTYRAAPTVSSVSANSGVQAGGTPVTITGVDFLAGAMASIDGITCAGIDVVNSTTITCITPAHAAGAVSVSVTNTDGQSGSAAAAYTYTAIPVLAFQTGVASPNPPNPDSFGSTSTNVTHTFTIVNSGEGTSSTLSITLSGTDPAAFLIGTDNCTGFTLAPAATCTVQLTFLGAFLSTGSYSVVLNTAATPGGTATNSVSGSVP